MFRASPYDAGKLMSQAQFLHNTKVGTSEYNEKKAFEKSRDSKLPNGRCMPILQMVQMMLGYPEVFTDMEFVMIPTLPYEQRSCVEQKYGTKEYVNDEDYGMDLRILSHEIRQENC